MYLHRTIILLSQWTINQLHTTREHQPNADYHHRLSHPIFRTLHSRMTLLLTQINTTVWRSSWECIELCIFFPLCVYRRQWINPLQDVMFNVYRPCNMAATKKAKPIRKGFAHRNGIASTWGFTNQKSIEPPGFHPEGILNKDGVGRGVYQTDGFWDFVRPSQMTWWRNYPRFWIWRRFSLFEVMSTVRLCASFYGHIASTSFACRRQVSVGWICQRTISDEIGILLSYKFLGVCNEIEYSFPPQDRVWLLSYFISIRIFAPPNLAHCWWSFFALWTWKNMTWTSYFIWCVCASWMHTRFADYSLSTGRGWSFPSVLNG